MQIITTATLSKSISAKREKLDDESERVIGHLKFSDAFVSREEIDGVLGIGGEFEGTWARQALFDQLGAPRARLDIAAVRRELTASVRLSGKGKEEMHVAGGTLSKIVLTLDKSGALMAGELTWEIAGDELSDAEPLLGQIVRAALSLTDGGQDDLLRKAA